VWLLPFQLDVDWKVLLELPGKEVLRESFEGMGDKFKFALVRGIVSEGNRFLRFFRFFLRSRIIP